MTISFCGQMRPTATKLSDYFFNLVLKINRKLLFNYVVEKFIKLSSKFLLINKTNFQPL